MADTDTQYSFNPNPVAMAATQIKKYQKEKNEKDAQKFIQSQDTFLTPDMGDYYLGAIDDTYLQKIDAMVNGKDPNKEDENGDGENAAFYAEKPPTTTLGMTKGAYFLKVKVNISDDDIKNGWTNGKTLSIPYSSIDTGTESNTLNSFTSKLNSTDSGYESIGKGNNLIMNLYGIDSLVPAKWAVESDVPKDEVETKEMTVADAIGEDYVVSSSNRNTTERITVGYICGKWREIKNVSDSGSSANFKWCVDSGTDGEESKSGADVASNRMQSLIKNANNEVYILVDDNAGYETPYSGGDGRDEETAKTLAKWAGNNKHNGVNGYSVCTQDDRGQISGAAYIKQDGKWINLAKAAMCGSTDEEKAAFSPVSDYPGNGTASDWKLDGYDKENKNYADAYMNIAALFDDREKIQKKLIGKNPDTLKDWTVSIGDVTLLVPPTNITVVAEIDDERVPLLRANGSMAKSGKRTYRMIQMEIYFSGDDGINGIKYEDKSPNGHPFTYKMDGLRALISQFKFTPFLPIENTYINETCGIEAVVFNSVNVSSVNGFPTLMRAQVIMAEFDYLVYMPELVASCAKSDDNINVFSKAFNWPTMRYYYQRCIMNGDSLQKKNFDITSKDYLKETLKNRTSLQPMKFMDSGIKFYIADASYLDKMLKAKLEADKGNDVNIAYNKDEVGAMGRIGTLNTAINEALDSDDFKNKLKELNDMGPFYAKGTNGINAITSGGIDGTFINDDKYPWYSAGTVRNTFVGQGKNADNIDAVEQKMNDCLSTLQEKLKDNPEIDSIRITTYHTTRSLNDTSENSRAISFGISIKIKDEYLGTDVVNDTNYNKMKEDVAPFIDATVDSFFNNRQVFIPITLNLSMDNKNDKNFKGSDDGFYVDSKCADMRFLNYCSNIQDKYKDKKDEDYSKDSWRKAPNLDQLDNLSFISYDLGKLEVIGWNASLSNKTSKINVCDVSGATPQYLGGEDTIFSVEITTTDKKTVQALVQLPKVASSYTRRYRAILPCYPLKVDSEFTHFFGVDEVALENVKVDTVPNMPGTYVISLSMRSLDRTLRNREALQMIEADNAGQYASDFFSLNNAEDEFAQKGILSYFDTEKMISQAELYPDLELPSLVEMESLGWEFVRYKFQDERVYVDPDFYFVYMYRLSSQVNRELILSSVGAGVDGSATYTDASGASVQITPQKGKGYKVGEMNDIAASQQNKIKKANDAKYKVNSKYNSENLSDTKKDTQQEDFEGWDICPDIKVVLLEKKYKKEFDSYVARTKAKSIGVTDSDSSTNTNGEESATDASDSGTTDTTADTSSENSSASSNLPTSSESAAAVAESTSATDSSTQKDTENKVISEGTTVADEDIDSQVPPGVLSNNVDTEGKWVFSKMGDAWRAGQLIDTYLNSHPIYYDVPDESPVLALVEKGKSNGGDTSEADAYIKTQIDATVADFIGNGDIQEILNGICIDYTDAKLLPLLKGIVYSAACAATGDKEFSNKKKATNWKPNPSFIAEIVGGSQDTSNKSLASTVEEGIEKGIRFGCFGIKQYDAQTFETVTEKYPEAAWATQDTVNTSHFLIDPYYRNLTEEEIARYKKGCINNPQYCTMAYLRIMLFWLKNLIDNQAFPSINADILRNSTKVELAIQKKQQENGVMDSKGADLVNHIAYFTKNSYAVDAGKFWTAGILASTDGNKMLRHRIHDRDYRGLNGYFNGVSVPKASVPKQDTPSMTMRKMSLALVGQGVIKDFDAAGINQKSPSVEYARDMTEKKYIDAAEDPNIYNLHACHDMIVYDARGRMLRAFPTYYMMFIDEGREVGSYHLHDNFYNNMSIMELTVVKSRKLPADTAEIKMSNIYQTLATEDEDSMREASVGKWRAFSSIFAPDSNGFGLGKTEGELEEEERKNKSPESKTRLRPGARIHLRMGYGSNATMMPVVFNGSIAEVDTQECVTIIAQGDGTELMNPIMDDEQAHEVTGVEAGWLGDWGAWFRNGCTPKNIMNHLLTSNGGNLNTMLKHVKPQLLGRNPYGIYHFGNPDFQVIAKSGETTQNIFEACSKPAWGQDSTITSEYAGDEAPRITMELFNKTIWDIANICKSVTPDYICGIAPFGYRSTLFIGAPRYYYAYDYTNINEAIQEKRKPYSQYHFYTSSTDIIANGISASRRDVKTVATGIYTVCASANTKEQHRVGPLYADIDIYPEEQRSMVVDTQLLGKGAPFAGVVTNAITTWDAIDDLWDDTGGVTGMRSHKKIAWRMTASKLKDSIKDMYCGDMVVIGDPSIKPHDRMYILDQYSGITGQATAKEVTHHMSIEQGFTTSISPDCINTVDDPHEKINHHWVGQVGGYASGIFLGTVYTALSAKFGKALGVSQALDFLKPTKTIEMINKFGSKSELAKGAIDAAKSAGNAAKDAAKSIASKASSSILKKLTTAAARGAVAGSVIPGPGTLTGAAAAVAVTIGFEIVGTFINSKLQNFLKNLQVITLYPLKKHNLTWTAGFEGSKGCIVGSPTYNEQGLLTSWASKLCGSQDNGVINFFTGLINNDTTKNIVDKYKRDTGVTDTAGDPTLAGQSFDNMVKGTGMANASAGEDVVKRGYHQMQISPRADYSKGDDVLVSYKHFAITDTEQYHNSPKMQYNNLISSDSRITPYIDEGFFKIIHETPALNKSDYVDTKILNFNGHDTYVKVIKYQIDNGDVVCDLPVLNKEAIDILYEILRRAKNNMPAANASDKYESYDTTKDSFIVLESALRVGDTQSQGAAGFTFILEAVKNTAQPLAAAIKELHEEVSKDAEGNSMMNSQLFDCSQISDTKVAIVVRMPKISGANDNAESVGDVSRDTPTQDATNSTKVEE